MAVVLLVLGTGLVLAPLGIQSLLLTSKLSRLHHINQLRNQVLDNRERSLEFLKSQIASARTRQNQISLVLGNTQEDVGLGGTPVKPSLEATSPRVATALLAGSELATESQALLALADEMIGFSQEHQQLIQTVPSICPLQIGSFVLTSPFGERISPFTNTRDFHTGLDLAAREGTDVFAPGEARVVFAGRFPLRRNIRWWRYGNVVVLRHGERYLTIFAHLQDISVRRGRTVSRGDVIGTVGNSGWSTSPHLHYEIRVIREDEDQPVPVDPRIYILDYQWTGHEAVLIAARYAPRPDFDPLPSRIALH
ncbi:MAG: M23 family metallopeptidase [Thermoanaerobaculales bacterium]|nr:M23 family metallopeptidase [Thermoanaerobaculales bacterium]